MGEGGGVDDAGAEEAVGEGGVLGLRGRKEEGADAGVGAVGADEEVAGGCGVVGKGGCDVVVCVCWLRRGGEGGEGFGPLGLVSRTVLFRDVSSPRRLQRYRWERYLHIHPLQQQRPQPFSRDPDPFAGRDFPLGLPTLQVEEQEIAILTGRAGFRIDVDFGEAVDQALGQEGEKLGQGPVDRQAPTAAAKVRIRVAFEDCAGDGMLLETLGEYEAGDASADDEDVRLRWWGGNCGGCHW